MVVPSTAPGLVLKCLFGSAPEANGSGFKHGGSEPKQWVQAEPAVSIPARPGATEAEGGPGGAATGHVPVLGL